MTELIVGAAIGFALCAALSALRESLRVKSETLQELERRAAAFSQAISRLDNEVMTLQADVKLLRSAVDAKIYALDRDIEPIANRLGTERYKDQ